MYGARCVQYVNVIGLGQDRSNPDSKIHGANMGPTWVLSAQDGPMLAPWTLLSGGRLNKKDGLTRYGDSHVKDKTS